MVLWQGTQDEASEMLAAAQHNCICVYDETRTRKHTCEVHKAITEDQGYLDRMVFYRRNRARLEKEENSG